MTHTRRLWALLALVLTLVLAACSTPEDLNVPTLEPQFGTEDEDIGVDVATVSTGRIYSLSQQSGPNYEYDYDGNLYQNGTYSKVLLKRQDGSGNVTWSKEVASVLCRDYDDYGSYYSCNTVKPISVVADAQGNVSVLTSYTYDYYDYYYEYSDNSVSYTIRKYNALGNYVSEVGFGDYGSNLNSIDFTVDGGGNFYVARRDGDSATNTVAQYSASGALLWQRTSTVGIPSDITVSSSGSVYVVGTAGIARYTSSGNLSWTKPGNFYDVIVSGSNIYTRYNNTLYKYDGTGRRLWAKTQTGLNTLVLQAIDGDGNGNVYLSGKYDADARTNVVNMNAMTRKLNASGSVLWTKLYGTSAYDDARGIATITGSEIYTTGETQGSLAHTNIGGRDGYLRKQNSTGGLVWTR